MATQKSLMFVSQDDARPSSTWTYFITVEMENEMVGRGLHHLTFEKSHEELFPKSGGCTAKHGDPNWNKGLFWQSAKHAVQLIDGCHKLSKQDKARYRSAILNAERKRLAWLEQDKVCV